MVDGGSRDDTAGEAERAGARVMVSLRGRATQMNAGAAPPAGTSWCSSTPTAGYRRTAPDRSGACWPAPGVVGGWFPQRIEAAGTLLRMGARGSNGRARWLQLPYGDQAIFTRRDVFRQVGGFPEDPIMEDAGLARRLQGVGRLEPAASAVTTGPEHWQRLGPVLTALLDYLTLVGWLIGVPPAWIARVYYPLQRGSRNGSPRRTRPDS